MFRRRFDADRPIPSASSASYSDADRVPDGLELEEAGDLPRALVVGRAAHHALDVLGREPLELRDLAIGARDVDRVHIHVPGEPWRELLTQAGEDVDDPAGDVGRR